MWSRWRARSFTWRRSDQAAWGLLGGEVFRLLQILWDTGLRLRCPVCEQGTLFRDRFHMHPVCPHCSVRFERHEGEVAGGMTVSITVTSLIFLVGLYLTEFVLYLPLWLQLGGWVLYAIFFPILFYRYSRALWVAILHLSGDVFWDQEPYIESELSILDAFLYRSSDEDEPPAPYDDDEWPPLPEPTPD